MPTFPRRAPGAMLLPMPMRREPICAGPAQLVRPVGLDAKGKTGPTRGQARGKGWRRTSRGFYVRASTDSGVPEQRIMEQSMPLGAAGAVTAWASLRMHRAGFFDGLDRDGVTPLPVPLISPDRQLRPLPGRLVCQDRLDASERVVLRDVPCTEVRRATFDEMRRADLRSAVTTLDMVAAAELTSVNRMRAYLATRPGWNGGPLVADALELADERSRSPGETRMRLIWILDAGLPRPVCNRALFSLTGELLGVPDLLDVEAGVVGEYDGADHLADQRRYRDLGREGRFRNHGLEYFTLVAWDMHDVDRVVERMNSTRSRALARGAGHPRAWTLKPPPGWRPFRSDQDLDERLEFREFLAEVTREA